MATLKNAVAAKKEAAAIRQAQTEALLAAPKLENQAMLEAEAEEIVEAWRLYLPVLIERAIAAGKGGVEITEVWTDNANDQAKFILAQGLIEPELEALGYQMRQTGVHDEKSRNLCYKVFVIWDGEHFNEAFED